MEGKSSHQPCAACRMLRRRCDSKCLLAPYFPADEVDKFAVVHRVFGASNVIKMIQTVEETQREDAVKAIVYEAMARVRDPVYGSAGAILHLQKMAEQLKGELQTMKARISEVQQQRDQLMKINTDHHHHHHHHDVPLFPMEFDPFFDDYSATLSSDPLEFLVQGDWVL